MRRRDRINPRIVEGTFSDQVRINTDRADWRELASTRSIADPVVWQPNYAGGGRHDD